MGTLKIYLFGTFRLYHEQLSQEIRLIPNVQSLLAYLLVQPGRILHRDGIAELLWGECSGEKAHCSLNTALWRLRRALEPDNTPRGTYLVCRSNNEIGFNWESDHWLDTREFESCARQLLVTAPDQLTEVDADRLERALSLYRGDFMDSSSENWVLGERERQRSLYLRCLGHLLIYSRLHGKPDQAIQYGERILKIDPLREEIHRELMRIYAQTGRRAMAIRQYEICRTGLMTELGLLPMAETRHLHGQIVKDNANPANRPLALEPAHLLDPVVLQQALTRVSLALNDLEETRSELQNIYTMLQRLQPPT